MNRRSRFAQLALLSGALMVLVAGCGQQFGALLYFLGVIPPLKVDAEFELTVGRLLVLIDDDADLVTQPQVFDRLTKQLAKELAANSKRPTKVIPYAQVREFQQREPKFSTMSAQQIGEALEADEVLWIKVDAFRLGSIAVSNVDRSAVFNVSLRVLDTHADSRDEVQLWPDSREPRDVKESLSLAKVQERDNPRIIAEMLTDNLAVSISLLFVYHEIDPADVRPEDR